MAPSSILSKAEDISILFIVDQASGCHPSSILRLVLGSFARLLNPKT